MTDRIWRIIEEQDRKRFYDKITKYELEGYTLLPESFGFEVHRGYLALMKNKNME
jgi:hypothetical protein